MYDTEHWSLINSVIMAYTVNRMPPESTSPFLVCCVTLSLLSHALELGLCIATVNEGLVLTRFQQETQLLDYVLIMVFSIPIKLIVFIALSMIRCLKDHSTCIFTVYMVLGFLSMSVLAFCGGRTYINPIRDLIFPLLSITNACVHAVHLMLDFVLVCVLNVFK